MPIATRITEPMPRRELVEMIEIPTQQSVQAGKGECGFRLDADHRPHLGARDHRRGVTEQGRLADAGPAGQDERRAEAVAGRRHRRLEGREFVATAENGGCGSWHGRIVVENTRHRARCERCPERSTLHR